MREQKYPLNKTTPSSPIPKHCKTKHCRRLRKKLELKEENNIPIVIKLLKQVANDNNYTDNSLVDIFAVFKLINNLFLAIQMINFI